MEQVNPSFLGWEDGGAGCGRGGDNVLFILLVQTLFTSTISSLDFYPASGRDKGSLAPGKPLYSALKANTTIKLNIITPQLYCNKKQTERQDFLSKAAVDVNIHDPSYKYYSRQPTALMKQDANSERLTWSFKLFQPRLSCLCAVAIIFNYF